MGCSVDGCDGQQYTGRLGQRSSRVDRHRRRQWVRNLVFTPSQIIIVYTGQTLKSIDQGVTIGLDGTQWSRGHAVTMWPRSAQVPAVITWVCIDHVPVVITLVCIDHVPTVITWVCIDHVPAVITWVGIDHCGYVSNACLHCYCVTMSVPACSYHVVTECVCNCSPGWQRQTCDYSDQMHRTVFRPLYRVSGRLIMCD